MNQELAEAEKLDIERIEQIIRNESDLNGLCKSTKEGHVFHIRKFLEFANKHPKLVTFGDARRYILSMKNEHDQDTINSAVLAIRFLYCRVWRRDSFRGLLLTRPEKDAQNKLSRHDAERIIRAAEQTKNKMLIDLLYSSGLNFDEVIRLKVNDFVIDDSILVMQGNEGKKYVVLSERFISLFSHHMQERYYNNVISEYLFDSGESHISAEEAYAIVKRAALRAGLDKEFSA
ncbi:tyrosine-type recombinase/integrase [Candidatus Woesearchaeota archaeon]|nr:tyrosine-type recombinase/integrase [Candidatus Woesearchaeota archaeon]